MLKARGKELLKTPSFYNDKELYDWSMRVVAHETVHINQTSEKLNVMTDISSMREVNGEKGAVLHHIDINTLQQNKDMRFGKEALSPFVFAALPLVEQLTKDVERLIYDEREPNTY